MKLLNHKGYNNLYLLNSSNGHCWFLFSKEPLTSTKLRKIAKKYDIPDNMNLDEIEDALIQEGYNVSIEVVDNVSI